MASIQHVVVSRQGRSPVRVTVTVENALALVEVCRASGDMSDQWMDWGLDIESATSEHAGLPEMAVPDLYKHFEIDRD